MGCSPSALGAQRPARELRYGESTAERAAEAGTKDGVAPDGTVETATVQPPSLAVTLRARRWADARAAVVEHPEAASWEDERTGDLPLHVILQARPLSRTMRNLQGNQGSIIESFLEACVAIVEAFPEACERHGSELTDSGGALPLHIACTSQAAHHVWAPQLDARLCRYRCESLVRKLIDHIVAAFPQACQEQAASGLRYMMRPVRGLPLHIAIACEASESVLDRLLSEHPAACREPSPNGDYPLHLAAEHHAKPAMIRRLIRSFPEACAIEDQLGFLPLHIAVKVMGSNAASSFEIVEELVTAHPEACARYENGQNLPLHLACKHSGKVDAATIEGMVRLLVAKHPDACKEPDSNSELPLHHAVRQKMSARGLECLLETHPHACLTPDKDGKLPLHAIVTDHDREVEAVHVVVKHCPAACIEKDSHGDLPIHAGIRHLRRHDNPDTSRLDALFHANPGTLQMRCSSDLHTPIDIACDSKQKLREWAITCGAFLRRYTIVGEIRTAYCHVLFGRDELCSSSENRDVCLKCVRHRATLEAEVQRRRGRPVPLSSKAVIRVLHWHTPEAEPFSFGESAEEPQYTQADEEFQYVIVMPLAECTLHDACRKERLARYDLRGIRFAMREIAESIKVLHDASIVHGDVKQRNVLRLRDSLNQPSYVLCDLDASNLVGKPLGDSSPAYAPPELARVQCTCPCGRSRNCKKCRGVESAEKAIDTWSFGVVLFEMCSGRTLFNQDVSNDDLVDENDCCRLCVWHTISDEELEPVLASKTTKASDAEKIAAKDLVRRCLQGDPALRPTIEDILEHPFLKSSSSSGSMSSSSRSSAVAAITTGAEQQQQHRTPMRLRSFSSPISASGGHEIQLPLSAPPTMMSMKYHGFMSHAQADASGTVGTLYLQYKQLGLHNWLDMHQETLTLEGMRQGVRDSSVFILILTEHVLSSAFCQEEMKEALRCNKPIQLVLEEDERFGAFDVRKWQESRLRARVFEWAGREVPPAICTMIDDNLRNAVTFRRRHFEAEAMMRALCERCGLTLPTDRAEAKPPPAATLTVFVICHKDQGFKILRTLQGELEVRKAEKRRGGNIELSTLPEKLATADRVLLLLTRGVLEQPSLGQLQQVLEQQSIDDHKDRIVALYSDEEEDGSAWTFGCEEHRSAPAQVKACLDEHEAITWRPHDPDGPGRHEFPAMVGHLVEKLTPSAQPHTHGGGAVLHRQRSTSSLFVRQSSRMVE